MSRTLRVDSIVLRAIDISEADRFCILFTREKGRLAARAKGVRKTSSRLGSLLLPFRHLSIEIAESDHSAVITSASDSNGVLTEHLPLIAFLRLEQGIELLLSLTEENEPINGVFDLLLQFITLAPSEIDPLPAFQLRLLHLLGFLPTVSDDARFRALPPNVRPFISAIAQTSSLHELSTTEYPVSTIERFIATLLIDHMDRPLKSSGMSLV